MRIHQSDRPDDEICLLFGRNPGRMERVQGEALETSQATPARLAVYDAPLDPESITAQMRENLDDELTEVKSENAIDRITSQANPRTLERVPAGARFKMRMVMDVLCEEDAPLFLRGARRAAPAGRRRAGRRRFARQRPRALLQAQPGVARQESLRYRCSRKGNQRGRHSGGHSGRGYRIELFLPERGVMNPGLVVKLRPSGPWRIGPDSGARNRVDVIYHSDSLYSAVTAAMHRLGWLEEWLDATARTAAPAVSFSSCFPYLGDTVFVVPPRTVWPPSSPSARSARVRWKSARFVPLTVVQSILSGQRLDENHWSVDGPSDCLVPAGKPGPFRTAVRSSAGVDRLTGASERHSTACIEFRPGCGLWTVVSFADEAARERGRRK